MFGLPLADWIASHLLEIHGIGFNAYPTWVPFVCGLLVLGIFRVALGLPWLASILIATPMTIIMTLAETSHGVHGEQGLLGTIGINWHVLYVFITAGIVSALALTAAQDRGVIPGTLRALMEMLIEVVRSAIVEPVMGEDGKNYQPYLMSFFCCVLVSNLLGLTPASTTATGNIFCTAGLAMTSVLFYHGMGIRRYGIIQHIVNFVPVHADLQKVGLSLGTTIFAFVLASLLGYGAGAGVGIAGGLLFLVSGFSVPEMGSVVLWWFMLGIELVGHMAKPFALAVRLFANMTGGHAVLYVMFGFGFFAKSYLVAMIVSIPASFAITMLELMVAVIQGPTSSRS